jgi:hypothetical protein
MKVSTPYGAFTLEAKWLMPAGTFAEDTEKDPKALFAARRTCFGRRPRLVDEYNPSNRRINFPLQTSRPPLLPKCSKANRVGKATLFSVRDQSALGRRRIVNSMRPPESSRQDSISVI